MVAESHDARVNNHSDDESWALVLDEGCHPLLGFSDSQLEARYVAYSHESIATMIILIISFTSFSPLAFALGIYTPSMLTNGFANWPTVFIATPSLWVTSRSSWPTGSP